MSSKRYKKLPEKTKDLNAESIEKLLPELKKNCTTKFDESLDLSFQINNTQKKSEVNIRTVINLPGGSSKKVKIGVHPISTDSWFDYGQWSEINKNISVSKNQPISNTWKQF